MEPGPAPDGLGGVLLQGTEKARPFQELQVIGQGHRVPSVLELPQHLCVGEHLAAVEEAKLQDPSEEGGFLHPGVEQDIASQGGF